MTEIKRYAMNKANMIGFVRFEEKESGRWVKHEDHAAIVAALKVQLSSYSMSAGQADQRKAESDAVRVALGFTADADDVSPSDLVDAIAALQEQVRALAAENVKLRDWLISDTCCEIDETAFPATDAALREIRADGAMACGVHLREWYDYQVEERAEEFAAAIRTGEQP